MFEKKMDYGLFSLGYKSSLNSTRILRLENSKEYNKSVKISGKLMEETIIVDMIMKIVQHRKLIKYGKNLKLS